jgi:uncharacterized protein
MSRERLLSAEVNIVLKMLPLAIALSSTIPVAVVGSVVASHKDSPTPAEPRTLAVAADAQINVVPDQAKFTVVVDASDVDKKRAQQLVQERTAKVIEAATKAGVKASGITIAHLSLSPEYALDAKGRPIYTIVKRWIATRTITVCVDDLKRMNDVFGAVIDAGGIIQGNVTFDTSRLEELREAARKRAAQIARTKAETLVETLGGKLGLPRSISEVDPSWSGPVNYANAVEDWRNGAFTDGAFSAGSMTISAHIDVTFEVS